MHKDHRGSPGGMGRGASGLYGSKGGGHKRTHHKVGTSKGGGNKRGGIGSGQVHKAHNRHKMNNNKIVSAMKGK